MPDLNQASIVHDLSGEHCTRYLITSATQPCRLLTRLPCRPMSNHTIRGKPDFPRRSGSVVPESNPLAAASTSNTILPVAPTRTIAEKGRRITIMIGIPINPSRKPYHGASLVSSVGENGRTTGDGSLYYAVLTHAFLRHRWTGGLIFFFVLLREN